MAPTRFHDVSTLMLLKIPDLVLGFIAEDFHLAFGVVESTAFCVLLLLCN